MLGNQQGFLKQRASWLGLSSLFWCRIQPGPQQVRESDVLNRFSLCSAEHFFSVISVIINFFSYHCHFSCKGEGDPFCFISSPVSFELCSEWRNHWGFPCLTQLTSCHSLAKSGIPIVLRKVEGKRAFTRSCFLSKKPSSFPPSEKKAFTCYNKNRWINKKSHRTFKMACN